MPVGEQIAVLYCGTRALMRDIPVARVREFQEAFLERMRASHKADVLEPLAAGKLSDEITSAIEKVAADVVLSMKE